MPHERPEDSRPTFTLSEAARSCGVSRSTLRRRHENGDFSGAYKDAEGAWRIPIQDLIGVGLNPGRPSPPDAVSAPSEHVHQDTMTMPVSEWNALTERLAVAERERAVAEARLDERAQVVEALKITVRAIEMRVPNAASSTTESVVDLTDSPVTQESVNNGAPKGRRWWRKR